MGARKEWIFAATYRQAPRKGGLHANDLRHHNCLTCGFLATGNQWKLIGSDGDHWLAPRWVRSIGCAALTILAGRQSAHSA
jgi:hypothetical protein